VRRRWRERCSRHAQVAILDRHHVRDRRVAFWERPAPALADRSTGQRKGLRKPSPDLISKARDETATQVTRIGLTFLGTTAFCLLSLFTPDSALLVGGKEINVPFAGPVSF
jgi:hypothetical protein